MNDNDIIEVLDDIDTNSSQQSSEANQIQSVEQKVAETKFEMQEPEQEKIEVVDEEQSRNKSGLILVIVLFVLLGLFILFLPKITEIFGSLF